MLRKMTSILSKFFVANGLILLLLMLLPVFLVTDNVEFIDHIMDYLFNNNS